MNLKSLASIFLFLLISHNLAAQSLPANTIWEGKLGSIRLVLKLTEDSVSKQQVAEFDSPDQGALGLKVSDLTVTKDSLSAFSSQIGGGFSGAFNSDKTEIIGQWKQSGSILPLVLKKTDKLSEPKRPQTPKAPFPYLEENVIYYNSDRAIQYGATLTLPDTNQHVPAVILITGSGQQDRDETLFGHKPFWVIADHLSRNGIAVLRVDDRGVGETTGDIKNATSADFANDVLVGIEYLKSRKEVNGKRIGLIGHSEGGVIAPLVAIQSSDVAFIVSLAGVGVKGSDLMTMQLKQSYRRQGFNEEEVNRLDSLYQMMIGIGVKYSDRETIKSVFEKDMQDWLDRQPSPFLEKAGFKGPHADPTIDRMASMIFSSWMRYFLKYDPATTLSKITIPVLALNGEKDVQVDAEANLAGFSKLLRQAGNKNFQTVSLPNLNHLFQHAETGDLSEYANIEETISPEVLNIMTRWIKGLSEDDVL